MKKQLSMFAAAAMLVSFAAAASAAPATVTMAGGMLYSVEYDLLGRTWDAAEGGLNNAAPAVSISATSTGTANVGTITLSSFGGAYSAAISGTVSGFGLALGSVDANWDGFSGNTGNPGAKISKTVGATSYTFATTGAIASAAVPAGAAVAAIAEVPGVALVEGALVPWTSAKAAAEAAAIAAAALLTPPGVVVKAVVVHPFIPAFAAVPATPAVEAKWDIVNAGRVSTTIGKAAVTGGLVLDPSWNGLGYAVASSKLGIADITVKAGKLLGTAGSAAAVFGKVALPVGPVAVVVKVAKAPAAYKYAHIDSADTASGSDAVEMEKLGWVASQADRNNGINAFVQGNMTVGGNGVYASFDNPANGAYSLKAGTSYKALYVTDAYVCATGAGDTEFKATFAKGSIGAFVGYNMPSVGAAQTTAEVKVTKVIDWLTTWASVGKAYTSSKPYIKAGASASVSF